MKNRITYIFILLISFLIVNSFLCTKKNNCDSVDKVDLLIKDILSKDYVYATFLDQPFKLTYLCSEGYIKPGKVFIGRDSSPVVSLPYDTLKHKDINSIYIYDIRSNYDTTDVTIKVASLIYGKYNGNDVDLHYLFDEINCNWNLESHSIRHYK
ncbi:MAG: hypothetical protein ISS16_10935 [Ignavibacteria bacterium]|nr:hypothetical protein [Ignavibacteria bacterium]